MDLPACAGTLLDATLPTEDHATNVIDKDTVMTFRLVTGGSAAVFCSIFAQAALAEISPRDVWAYWQEYMTASGYEISASEQMSGDTLTISDITLTLPAPEDQVTMTVVIPSIALTGNSEGTVSAAFPSPMPMQVTIDATDAEVGSGEVVITHSGSSMLISGEPSNLTYTHASDETTVTLTNLTVEGEPVPPETLRFSVVLTGTSGTSQMTRTGMRSFDELFRAESLSYDFAFDDPDSDDQGQFSGELRGLNLTANGAMPLEMNANNMAAALEAGFNVAGTFAYDAGKSSMAGTGDGESFSASSASQGGTVSVAFDASQLAYDLTGNQTEIEITSQQLPFPISLEMAETALKLAMPVARSEEPQDFAFGLTLRDFVMSDMIWGMFDPAGTLPRDPATVSMDLTGKAKLDVDIMDPAATAALDGTQPPGELHAVTINDLLVSMIGAKLTGTGAFTFDNADMQTFPGMPRPEGFVELALTGANAVLDKLIQMGFVSDNDAMGARMMMGMFAVPGEGEDSLKSRIEINEQGQVLANGQRIR